LSYCYRTFLLRSLSPPCPKLSSSRSQRAVKFYGLLTRGGLAQKEHLARITKANVCWLHPLRESKELLGFHLLDVFELDGSASPFYRSLFHQTASNAEASSARLYRGAEVPDWCPRHELNVRPAV